MGTIAVEGIQGQMSFAITNMPAFPGARFGCGFPEAIGDAAAAVWFGHTTAIGWEERANGAWFCAGVKEGELSYTMTVRPFDDGVDCLLSVTNQSGRRWKQSLAFNCVNPGASDLIRDHECVRHWVGQDGQLKRLIEVPRVFGPRPAIQLYSVEGAPPGKRIPFVNGFKSTPDVVLEGWIAIQSPVGTRLMAAVSKPSLFLFQNMEYSCIHSAAGFGPLRPGETGTALTRIYCTEATVEDWYPRMKDEIAQAHAAKKASSA